MPVTLPSLTSRYTSTFRADGQIPPDLLDRRTVREISQSDKELARITCL